MGAVSNHKGSFGNHIKTPLPFGCKQSLTQLFLRHRKAAPCQSHDRLYRQYRVFNLKLPCQRNLQVFIVVVRKTLLCHPVLDLLCPRDIRCQELSFLKKRRLPQNLHHFRRLLNRNYITLVFYNPCLNTGDFLQGLAENLHMVHTDGRKDCRQRIVHDIGGIQRTAQPGFQHYQIAGFVQKPEKCHRRLHLKERGMSKPFRCHSLCRFLHRLQIVTQPRLRDDPAIHLKPLPVLPHRRGQVSAHPIPCSLHHRGDVGKGGALSISAGDMYEFQLLLRIAQTGAQLPHRLQTHNAAERLQFLYILHGFPIVHGFPPSVLCISRMYKPSKNRQNCLYEKIFTKLHSLRTAGMVFGNHLYGIWRLSQARPAPLWHHLNLDVSHLRSDGALYSHLPPPKKPFRLVSRNRLYRIDLCRRICHGHLAEPP